MSALLTVHGFHLDFAVRHLGTWWSRTEYETLYTCFHSGINDYLSHIKFVWTIRFFKNLCSLAISKIIDSLWSLTDLVIGIDVHKGAP